MSFALIEELRRELQSSDAKQRKQWALRIVSEQIPLSRLMVLIHIPNKTAQRFTWLIGDLLETEPAVVQECLPLLFSLRDEMPFPGMDRTVAKCLWYLGLPVGMESEAAEVLFRWLEDDDTAVAVKHFASKALVDLAVNRHVDSDRLDHILTQQTRHRNPAHARRMAKLQESFRKLIG